MPGRSSAWRRRGVRPGSRPVRWRRAFPPARSGPAVAWDSGVGATAGAAEGAGVPGSALAGATVGAVACAGSLAAVFLGWSVSQPALNSTAHSRAGVSMQRRNFMRARTATPEERLRTDVDGTTPVRGESTKRDRAQAGGVTNPIPRFRRNASPSAASANSHARQCRFEVGDEVGSVFNSYRQSDRGR